MNGDQSLSPLPRHNETALLASSSVIPNIPLLLCSERFEGVVRDMDRERERDLERDLRREEGAADADDLSLRGLVRRPYRTPLEGVASTGGMDCPSALLKSIICVGSSGSSRMSYSRSKPSEVRTRRVESSTPHGWNETLAMVSEERV